MLVIVYIRSHFNSSESNLTIQFTCGWEGRGLAMEHTNSRFEAHHPLDKVESLQERVNLQLEQWKIDMKKDIQDMVMEQNRQIWLRCQAELAALREELQRLKGDRQGKGVGVHVAASSSNGKVVSMVSQGGWRQAVNINAASSSCDYVGINHREAGQAAFDQMIEIDSFDYAPQLYNRSAVEDFPEACQNEFGYLKLPRPEQQAPKRANGALPARAAEAGQHQADPLMPRFVDLSALSSSTWFGDGAHANSTTQEALSSMNPPPGFGQEDLGRGKHEKRQEIIQCIKLKSSYKEYALIRDQGGDLPCEVPGTPDPQDESISKRKWESLVSKWRAALRQVEKMRNGMSDEIAEQ